MIERRHFSAVGSASTRKRRKLTKRQRRQVAFYEAGHAIERMLCGYRVRGLSMDDVGEVSSYDGYDESLMDCDIELRCLMAGSVAQAMSVGRKWQLNSMMFGFLGFIGRPEGSDFNRAFGVARRLHHFNSEAVSDQYRIEDIFIERKVLPEYAKAVEEHLRSWWPLVESVAHDLEASGALTEQQFIRAVGRGMNSVPIESRRVA